MSVALGLLWFVPIAFMFYCQHHVCEEYFIPAINVLVSRANASPNKWINRWGESAVAGATIMALGCNGPELFCNLISLYIGSDAGIGVVVGSEIFNLLIIIGCSVLFCPTMPLVLERASFIRDCAFYALSIGLLVWALMIRTPYKIDPTEAFTLLAAEFVFVTAVYFTSDIVGGAEEAKGPAEALLDAEKAKTSDARIHGIDAKVTQVPCGRMQCKGQGSEDVKVDPMPAGIMFAASAPEATVTSNPRGSVGFDFGDDVLQYKDLREVRVVENSSVFYMDFAHNSLEAVTLKVVVEDPKQRKTLLDNIVQCSLGRKPTTEAGEFPEEEAGKVWVHNYDPSFGGAIAHFKHTMGNSTWDMKVLAIVELLADCMLKPTLSRVDVKDVTKEDKWPMCFFGAMCWLAVYSFLMLEVATQINVQIPALSMAFLGVTVCAIGTSFPNAIASILMSKQDKSAAAIANALGSNVQNVFLAMAAPWVIFMATPTSWSYYLCVEPREQWTPVDQDPPETGQSIAEGVMWMMGTLILVVVMALMPTMFTFSKSYGIFLCSIYVVYLIWTSYEALFM